MKQNQLKNWLVFKTIAVINSINIFHLYVEIN